MQAKILLILGIGEGQAAEQRAFDYASENSMRLDVIDVLDSHLYHYGKNDYIIPSYARTQFLFHIQDNLFRDSRRRAQQLRRKAAQWGVALRYTALETDEPFPHILKTMEKGYSRLFVPMKKRKWLPLRQPKSLQDRLRGATAIPVSAC